MATGNRKTKGKGSQEERMEEGLRWIKTGEAAAMAYVKFLRDNERYGTLHDIVLEMYAEPHSASIKGQAAAFFGKIEDILRIVAPLLRIRRADDHDQMCAAFVDAFNLSGPRRAAYLKELPPALPQILIKEEEAAAKKAAVRAEAEAAAAGPS